MNVELTRALWKPDAVPGIGSRRFVGVATSRPRVILRSLSLRSALFSLRTPRLLAGLTASTRASPTAELSPTVLLCRPQAPNAHLAGCHALPELLLN